MNINVHFFTHWISLPTNNLDIDGLNRNVKCKGIEQSVIDCRDIESFLFMTAVLENFHELEELEGNKATYKTIKRAYESNKY